MSVKLIVTDLDGCLHSEASVTWDLDLLYRISNLCRSGDIAPITICTARPQPYIEALMKILDVRVPAICENGAVVYSLHDNRSHYGPGVTEAGIHALQTVRRFIEAHILPHYPNMLIQFGKEANLSLFCEQPELFEAIIPRIHQFNADVNGPSLTIVPSQFYLNIAITGVDKGTTVRALLAELDIKPEEAAGIGDTAGDLPLRESVGFFACPANATPNIKDMADYISPYPEMEGMLDILSQPQMRAMP